MDHTAYMDKKGTTQPPPEKTFNELLAEAYSEIAAREKLRHVEKQMAEQKEKDAAEKHQQAMEELYERTKAKANQPELKLFRVTIPSQTLSTKYQKGKKLVVGEITEYGFIQGREIVVLATSRIRLHGQCLKELGCKDHEVDMTVDEITGPFEHGVVIAYNGGI